MKELIGDLWEAHDLGHWVAITTNPIINAKGNLVMGRGVALEAAKRWPELPYILAQEVRRAGNHVAAFPGFRVIMFPVKTHWRDKASFGLIRQSARELVALDGLVRRPIYMVRPGCGNGGLRWEDVKPDIAPILKGDDYIIVERP